MTTRVSRLISKVQWTLDMYWFFILMLASSDRPKIAKRTVRLGGNVGTHVQYPGPMTEPG